MQSLSNPVPPSLHSIGSDTGPLYAQGCTHDPYPNYCYFSSNGFPHGFSHSAQWNYRDHASISGRSPRASWHRAPVWFPHRSSRVHTETLGSYGSESLITRFMGPTWVQSGADRTKVGPMLAPWTLLSGNCNPRWWDHLRQGPQLSRD